MSEPNKILALTQCTNEYGTLLLIANIFLWAAIIAAGVIFLLSVVERIAALKKPPAALAAGGAAGQASLLDSLKGLVTALATAPVWFAIFLAGLALLSCSDRFTPTHCAAPAAEVKTQPHGGAGTP